ncbi:Hypothetical protein NATL1_00771 [Prochlorococcus marinus str. NATL1A]|uniref:Uncharacterized protein n=1 Tax=Prochlorococcus marinus (strain NATL1A) TaxID=167555 RepID=A2BZI1_PROM1|nr:Hypothetical protein NATL1_00771 [Prochlorococcus marinus str. NATL1A]
MDWVKLGSQSLNFRFPLWLNPIPSFWPRTLKKIRSPKKRKRLNKNANKKAEL